MNNSGNPTKPSEQHEPSSLKHTAPDGTMIRTRFDPPPIPGNAFDWSAVTDNYEPGEPIGYGCTETGAVNDLLEQLED